MFSHHLQHFEILLKCLQDRHISKKCFYNISESIKYLFVFKNISESWNYNVTMKYFAIFDKNVKFQIGKTWTDRFFQEELTRIKISNRLSNSSLKNYVVYGVQEARLETPVTCATASTTGRYLCEINHWNDR